MWSLLYPFLNTLQPFPGYEVVFELGTCSKRWARSELMAEATFDSPLIEDRSAQSRRLQRALQALPPMKCMNLFLHLRVVHYRGLKVLTSPILALSQLTKLR